MANPETSFKGGLELRLIDNLEFESMESLTPKLQAPVIARNVLRFIMGGMPEDSLMSLLSWDAFKAIFIQRDPKLLRELRLAFQQGFEILMKDLEGKRLNSDENEQVQLYLSNCLSFLPYGDLNCYESIKIPQFQNGFWKMVDYYIQPIELTDEKDSNDEDKVFAYGLEPIVDNNAQSHLIFMGTTYPAGQGFLPQVNSDFKSFETVGNSLYLSGRARIEKWLLSQKGKIHVCGVSLGGSLSLLLAIDKGQYLSRVDALNPVGLYEYENKMGFDHWATIQEKPLVIIQKQANDPASLLGVWKNDWNLLQVTPPKHKKGANPIFDHFLNYAGFSETEFRFLNTEDENIKRKESNFWIYTLGRSWIYYTTILPYQWVIRPLIRFCSDKMEVITAGLLLLALAISAVALAVVGSISPPLLVVVLSFVLVATVSSMVSFFLKKPALETACTTTVATLHDPKQPRNETMNTHNCSNQVALSLTFQEFDSYKNMMEGFLKQKGAVPKMELTPLASGNESALITLRTTKAVAVYIKHSLCLIQQMGLENKKALDKALAEEGHLYEMGI